MDEMNNPYRPGAGSQPPALLGRDALLNRFGVTIRRSLKGMPDKSLMAIGLRGVGKTVLLNRFQSIAGDEGFSTSFIEASENREFRTTLGARLRKVAFDLERRGTTEAIRRMLGILKAFSMQLPDGTSMAIDVDPLFGQADSGILTDDITDLLVGIGEAARSKGMAFLLLIDEVQYLSEEELGALIMAVHRSAQLNLPVVLVGAGLPQLPALAGEARSYAERLFDFPEIGELTEEDAKDALRIPAQEGGADFEEAALDTIYGEAHGYPYFLQEWGFNVWNLAEGPFITQQVVEQARPQVIQRLDENFFRVRYDRLTPSETRYMRAMAELGPGPHRSGEIADCLEVKVQSVAPRRSGLIKKGMIFSPAHGDTAFTVPLFDEFLRRKLPDWP